ncbi:saccharopine dehydrogenase NADP-binding domain-containing protein [Bacillus sp. B15-48]|uniref:saccharopine dehydrogenase family protein n=1 Tax=Bacillus sp. B15-48 TaxID=1548601 RepID=UPI00193F93DF|nr:saccharopine dehydrogenase NADP-binding domain-containing protein [Bacillus sp. B15-48]MBM4761697.1 hypothetical protein [Bacillus sp. B15-48]
MKVLLIGAGTMGRGGIQALRNFPGIESVTVADLNKEAADKFAATLNFPEVKTVQLDVTDSESVTALAREVDVVFNAVGPFVKFGVPILKAVIEAGTDYVDVCDDGDATDDLLELHEKAEAAGVTALIGCGQTPGISNMQAKYVAGMMDDIDSIKIAWHVGSPQSDLVAEESYDFVDAQDFKESSPAGWNHLVHSMTGDIVVWKDGKFDKMPAWDSGEYIDFPEPYGRVPVFYVGHSEPHTLPRYIKINEFCACLGGNRFHKELREEARGYQEPKHPPVDPGTPIWEAPEKWKDKGVWQGQAAIVEGTVDGKKVRYTNRYMCSVYDKGIYTFAGQAIGIYLIGTMKNKKSGVFGPEGILETEDFFKELVRITNESNGWDFTLEELLPIEKEILG